MRYEYREDAERWKGYCRGCNWETDLQIEAEYSDCLVLWCPDCGYTNRLYSEERLRRRGKLDLPLTEIAKDLGTDMKIAAIARKWGCNESTLRDHLYRAGLRHPVKLDIQRTRILELHNLGWSNQRIAEELGKTRDSVQHIVYRARKKGLVQ